MIFHGIDIVYIPSFETQLVVPGSHFDNVFSALELRLATTKTYRAAHLAGRWAAKEAFIKAWSQSLFGMPPVMSEQDVVWAEIEVIADRWGRPQLQIKGSMQAKSGISQAQLSISHDGDYAIASCLLHTDE
ncbi:phosphopantetheine--protein transferase [Corynebacterium kutscheri]|uniref:Holo-[acyl-carrier-protein] synthase n=1 Tax=Corynebacterium kutscheri TaxID=35755 RepID=A0A0F6R2K6_9CORY|nr:phosphopantetheine--protein transferase [Corynebacterium kutscheri]VEH10045.1 4'-phosphopantetheinyl transferase [Corynebacterium kutscheri]